MQYPSSGLSKEAFGSEPHQPLTFVSRRIHFPNSEACPETPREIPF